MIGFGALNVDKLYKVEELVYDGESLVHSYEETAGGCAANTIVGLARLGLKTGFIGKVARDREGMLLLEDFEKERVDVAGIIIAERGKSGTVLGVVDKQGKRALYIDPGVNDELAFEEINLEYASSARLIHMSSFVGEKPFMAQIKLVEKLGDDILFTLDPSELYAKKGIEKLRPLLKKCKVFFPNKREIELLTNRNYLSACELLLKEGVEIIAIKLGEKGCYVASLKERYHIPSYEVEARDTTGAGDAFAAGFLYGLLKNKDLYQCGKIGNYVASRCILEYGARRGLPKKISTI